MTAAARYIETFTKAFGYAPTLTREGKAHFIETKHGKSPCTYSDKKLNMLSDVLVREMAVQS
jgi:hypothetical protein